MAPLAANSDTGCKQRHDVGRVAEDLDSTHARFQRLGEPCVTDKLSFKVAGDDLLTGQVRRRMRKVHTYESVQGARANRLATATLLSTNPQAESRTRKQEFPYLCTLRFTGKVSEKLRF